MDQFFFNIRSIYSLIDPFIYSSNPKIENLLKKIKIENFLCDDQTGNTKLLNYIFQLRSVNEIKNLLEEKIFVNYQNRKGNSSLHILIKKIPFFSSKNNLINYNNNGKEFNNYINKEKINYFKEIIFLLFNFDINFNLINNFYFTSFDLFFYSFFKSVEKIKKKF